MKQYIVTAMIVSGDNPPVSVQWYKGTNGMKAVAAMIDAATNDEDRDWGDLPESMRYRTLSVDVNISTVEGGE